jgi:Cu+-exporting ATPase
MVCGSCVSRITRAVKRLDGVSGVRVDLGRETVTVRLERASVSDATLAAAVAEAGYEADLASAVLVPVEDVAGPLARLVRRFR